MTVPLADGSDDLQTMNVIDVGHGDPLVLIPGLQGRWEYLQAAVDSLAETFRVITFALAGERGSGVRFDPTLGLDNYTHQVAAVLDRFDLQRATICGISFGGLAALRFAACRPERTGALVLASTPGSGFRLRSRHRAYSRVPWLFMPLFLAETPFRLRGELAAAFPRSGERWRFGMAQLGTLARAPLSPARLAERALLIADASLQEDCLRVTAPTLLITGERGLDRVVAVDATLNYLNAIPGATHRTLERTGHLGSITRPEAFAALIRQFVDRQARTSPPQERRHASA